MMTKSADAHTHRPDVRILYIIGDVASCSNPDPREGSPRQFPFGCRYSVFGFVERQNSKMRMRHCNYYNFVKIHLTAEIEACEGGWCKESFVGNEDLLD